jgi:formate dehydrogenase subunit delta
MASQELKQLIKMAQQIAANLAAGVDANTAAARTADHLRRFWTPAMRSQLLDYWQDGEGDLDTTVSAALAELSSQATA